MQKLSFCSRAFTLYLLVMACQAMAEDEQIDIAELKKMSLEDILNIEVVSKKSESEYSAAGIVSIVTADDIKRYGGNTLADVLNRVTSVYMLSTYIWSDSTASVRGDGLTHVNNHTLVPRLSHKNFTCQSIVFNVSVESANLSRAA